MAKTCSRPFPEDEQTQRSWLCSLVCPARVFLLGCGRSPREGCWHAWQREAGWAARVGGPPRPGFSNRRQARLFTKCSHDQYRLYSSYPSGQTGMADSQIAACCPIALLYHVAAHGLVVWATQGSPQATADRKREIANLLAAFPAAGHLGRAAIAGPPPDGPLPGLADPAPARGEGAMLLADPGAQPRANGTWRPAPHPCPLPGGEGVGCCSSSGSLSLRERARVRGLRLRALGRGRRIARRPLARRMGAG